MELRSIAVSPSEQYIAFRDPLDIHDENGQYHKIRCFQTDGTFAFEYVITPEISSEGYCALWFDEDVLCVLFYRTHKVLHFAMDGTILETTTYPDQKSPPEYPSFQKNWREYIYRGKTIDVIYDKKGFVGYWFFHAERYLKVLFKNGEEKILWTGTTG